MSLVRTGLVKLGLIRDSLMVGNIINQQEGVIKFFTRNLVFAAGHYAYMDFTEEPIMGAAGTNGTISVNGVPIATGWYIDSIVGSRVYLSGTPAFISGDAITYSYDPDTDGGVTNAAGYQLAIHNEKPFTEIISLFRAAINEGSGKLWNLLVGSGTSTSAHADEILSLDFNGIYKARGVNLPVWRGDRQVVNLVADKDVPATEVIALKGGGYYIIQAKGTYNISITGAVTATLSGTAEHMAVELKPVGDGNATFTVNTVPDAWQLEDLTPEAIASGDLL